MAFARLQPDRFAFGKDNAGTTAAMSRASEARELDNIMMRYDMVYVRLEWGRWNLLEISQSQRNSFMCQYYTVPAVGCTSGSIVMKIDLRITVLETMESQCLAHHLI